MLVPIFAAIFTAIFTVSSDTHAHQSETDVSSVGHVKYSIYSNSNSTHSDYLKVGPEEETGQTANITESDRGNETLWAAVCSGSPSPDLLSQPLLLSLERNRSTCYQYRRRTASPIVATYEDHLRLSRVHRRSL